MITIDTKTIVTTIDNHKEAHDDNNMDVIAELDSNLHEIRELLNKIQYMSNYKASAASELIIEAVEDIYDYIRER
jgi:ArsR family metal-binding transcriptional regulator|tara:strand:+ start:107 stop:331 length:225 start_codon:yes stop_codon:yes gene_type:complete